MYVIYTVKKKRNWQGLEEGILSYHQAPCIKICFWNFVVVIVFLFLSHYCILL